MILNNGLFRSAPFALGKQLGYTAVIIYCLCISIASVWINTSFSALDGATLTFITIFAAQLIFILSSILKGLDLIGFMAKYIRSIIIINILTVTSWFFMFMALQKIEASVEAAIYQGWVPVAVLLCELFVSKTPLLKKRVVSVIFIFLSILILVYARIAYQKGLTVGPNEIYSGIILATVAGITAGIYIYYSSRMHEYNSISPLLVLSVRFVLLLIITGYMGFDGLSDLMLYNPWLITDLILLSLFIVVIPIYCLQFAIATLGGVRVSIIIPTVPAIALAVEYFISPWGESLVPIVIVVLCTCVIYSNHVLNTTMARR